MILKKFPDQQVKKKTNKLLLLSIGILLLSFMSQFVVSNMLAFKGKEVSDLEKKAGVLNKENQNLREELAGKTSMTQVAMQAEGLGLTQAGNIQYVDLTQDVALLTQ